MSTPLHATVRRTAALLAFLPLALALFALQPAQAQITDRPKAGPELKRLDVWSGNWTYEGTLHDTPSGPGGRFAGKESTRWTLDGLFQESRSTDHGVYGGKKMTYQGLVVRWYDAPSQTYRVRSFDNDGIVGEGAETWTGTSWVMMGRSVDSKGKETLSRGTTSFSADGKRRTSKYETSLDGGKTWLPLWDLTAKKR